VVEDRIDGWWKQEFTVGFKETSLGRKPQQNPAGKRKPLQKHGGFGGRGVKPVVSLDNADAVIDGTHGESIGK
jgi:hypothetical protein